MQRRVRVPRKVYLWAPGVGVFLAGLYRREEQETEKVGTEIIYEEIEAKAKVKGEKDGQ